MKRKILSMIIGGIAAGGMWTFFVITILMIMDVNPPISEIWINMLGGFLIGIYFGLASLIFMHEGWSPLKKTIMHFSFSLTIWFIIAFILKWFPRTFWSILLAIFVFIVMYVIFWSCFYLYFKKQEAALNDSLPKK